MSDCPLLPYLQAADEAPYLFARRAGIAQATIYALLNGTCGDVKWQTLLLIEANTKGQVTVQAMSDWLKRRLHAKLIEMEKGA